MATALTGSGVGAENELSLKGVAYNACDSKWF
jgi:hypothetical protein